MRHLFTLTDWVKPPTRYCCASHFPQPEAKSPVEEQEKQVAEGSRAVGHGPGAAPLRQAHQQHRKGEVSSAGRPLPAGAQRVHCAGSDSDVSFTEQTQFYLKCWLRAL